MKRLYALIIVLAIAASSLLAQETKVVENEFKVFGNCGMCKTRIEKAIKIKEVKYAKWNKETKILKVAFESSITADSLHKRIAAVGYDTELFKAPDSVYVKLPGCCLYRDNAKTH
ncbi:MAG: heavy-metal-associated domain-containing protein [Melioribacter sp.]|nr:heavy-metal-associated domain-containing protein [Melioribacter sp.]